MTQKCDKTIDAFEFKASDLVAGSVPERYFELLVRLTSLRSLETIAALKSHLVSGLSKSEAYTKHDVAKSLFSRRLKGLKAVHEIVEEACTYLP